ncbi:MAG: hypothetical protein Q9187_006784 [Circinaria calcarea]
MNAVFTLFRALGAIAYIAERFAICDVCMPRSIAKASMTGPATHTSNEHTKKETGYDDGKGRSTAMCRREVANQRKHELWCYGCESSEKGEKAKYGEGIGKA